MREENSFSDHKPVENADLSHDRILIILGLIVVIGTVVTGALVSLRFGAGFLVGGLFSVVNYFWMKTTLRKSFEMAAKGEATGYMGTRFVLRYFIFGLILAVVYLTGILSVIAVLIGVTGFALAIFVEGVINIFKPVRA